jgi:Molecular chaperone GrpE (heat shock protein)
VEDEKKTNGKDANDDSYVIEDTGESLEEFGEQLQHKPDITPEEPVPHPTSHEVADLEAENQQLRDQLMRKLADFDNFRKRTEREKADYFKYALADMIRSLLPVLDNFDRALVQNTDENDEFRKGIEMIYKQLFETLEKSGVSVISEAGVPFDPTIHEAVMSEANPDVPAHTVIDVMQKGYFLNDRLIRPAMVKVSVGGAEMPPSSD